MYFILFYKKKYLEEVRMKLKHIIYSSAIILGSLTMVANTPTEAASTSVKVAATESSETNWVSLGNHQNVDLNKVWTVNFSSKITMNKIDAIVVKTGNTFVPVKIVKNAQNQVQVTPVLGYTGNTSYEMQVYLTSGLKYKMTFTTKNAARNADIEPNNNYLKAQTIYANDYVKGTVNNSDSTDYYKVNIPADGTFDVTAVGTNGTPVTVYLYGAKGPDGNYISYNYKALTNEVSAGLTAGTYYIRVENSGDNVYELTTAFTENEIPNDKATSTYVQAPTLKLNEEVTGHIGYINHNVVDNSDDYYKVVLPENGTLDLEAVQLDGGKMTLYVYGKQGADNNYIHYEYNAATHKKSLRLQAGTYYIRLKDVGNYGAYRLKNTFTPEAVANDNASSNYVTAPELTLNKTVTGHIGHTNENVRDNDDDYYKVVVSETGTLKVQAKQLQGGKLTLYIYGENGSDGNYIDYKYNQSQANISEEVKPGTYYIRVKESGYSGTYELSTQLTK